MEQSHKKKVNYKQGIESQRHSGLFLLVCNNDALNMESNPESLVVKNKEVKMRGTRIRRGERLHR